jgi:hypothetical protein
MSVRCSLSWSSLPTGLCLLLASVSLARAQYGIQIPPLPTDEYPQQKARKILDRYPQNPTLPPNFTIALGPLGFSLPGENYLLRRQSLVSLDFIDEDRILFTFRVSGLMERDDDKAEGRKQQIKAIVAAVPTGKIESQATWIVPDRSRYLWMLNDGHFLLRSPGGLDEGDAQLKMTPYLRLPGRLRWIQMDPSQQFMITNSLEPASSAKEAGESGSAPPLPTTAPADGQKHSEQSVLVARTTKRTTGDVIRVTRVPWTSQTVDWPMNSDGYLERSHDTGDQWLLKLKSYTGGDHVLARITSRCPPEYNYISESELLVTTCDPDGSWKLAAISTRGNSLWEAKTGTNTMWPLLVTTPSGSRVARETLRLKRSAERYKHLLGEGDIQGQMVRVFDAVNGKMVLEAPLTPVLDGGGNVAISPSGHRVAILNAGAIQIFQLPAPSVAPPVNNKKD